MHPRPTRTTSPPPTTVLRARAVHTLDPAVPSGTAVAIADGRIVAVGDAADLVDRPGVVVDDRFMDAVLLPGFVEAHAHGIEGAVWAFPYVGRFDRIDPDGVRWPGCAEPADVLDRLRAVDAAMSDPAEPLIAWGLDPIYYPGERLVAEHLDRVSATRPIFVMHASFHLATVNSALMRSAGIDRDTPGDGVPRDAAGDPVGELREPAAMALAGAPMLRFFTAMNEPEAFTRLGRLARRAGVTTVTDLGNAAVVRPDGVDALLAVTGADDFPVRLSVFATPTFAGAGTDPDAVAAALGTLRRRSTDKLRLGHVKLILDGSIQGFTARLNPPGYVGGQPNGIWVTAPEQFAALFTTFHRAGATVHVHCNGDEAVDVCLDAVTAALVAHPRTDHRHTVQHGQLASAAQLARMADLGMCVNLFSNHLWYWGDQHAALTVGPERAATMNAAATALRLGVPLAIHSDAAVTPLDPLHVAWCAVNRITVSGEVLGPGERIGVADALRAVTIGGAYQLRLDDELGTLTPGKRADLVALTDDPLTVDPTTLRDVRAVGTVLGGVPTTD